MTNSEDKEKTTSLWEMYQDGISYQANSGLSKNLPRFVKFYEGDQWAPPTKNTKNLPRPVINIVKMICRNKKSAILATPVKIVYKAENEQEGIEKFNKFADYIQKELGQESLDKKAIDDGVKKGSYFYHYYWDSEGKGKDGTKEGALRCEIIDPLHIFFSNPTETDEQKQKWILIVSREDVESVRAKKDSDVDAESIVSDEYENRYGIAEQKGENLCTVLTRYFRQNGEVYWEKATKGVVINKPRPLAPDLKAAAKELGYESEEDAPNNSLPDATEEEDSLIPEETLASLYPIVVGNYEPREKSIYGLGEVEGIIPNQKAINFNLAMALLNAQEVAWGKYVVHPNALNGQVINNEPGQVLIDFSKTGQGIRKMTEQPIQTAPLQLIETITQLTRAVTGSSEVMTGETIGSNMSGAAIAQLQSQAQQPVEELKHSFWIVKEKQGKIMAQFFKLYYEGKEFSYEETKEEGESEKIADTFSGSDYKNVNFDVVVETTRGTQSSAAGDINALDTLLAKGAISIKTYLSCYPKDALSNVSELIKGVEQEENSKINQLSQQLQTKDAQIAQYSQIIQEQQATVDKVAAIIQENGKLKQILADLYSESYSKLNEANKQIELGNAKILEMTKDASEMAQHIVGSVNGGQSNISP